MTKKYKKSEIKLLAQKWRNDKTAENLTAVIVAMDHLVKWLVSKRKILTENSRIDRDDLLQVANMGIIRALEKYEGDRCFTTYATYWIKQYMINHINNEMHIVKYQNTANHQHIRYSYSRKMASVMATHGPMSRHDAHAIISEKYGIPVSVMEAYVSKTTACVSLSQSCPSGEADDGDGYIYNLTDDPHAEHTLCSAIDHKKCLDVIDMMSNGLSDREKDILDNYVRGGTDDTMSEIADRHGISRQRVQQIESELRSMVISGARSSLGLT